nr:hypothetical protein [Tanacetum cinerariifolium]
SIPSEDPYEETALQLFEQAPHSSEYVPRDHVPVFVPEFEHPGDLVPTEDEAPASLLPPGFLSPHIQPPSPRALGAEMNAIASSLYHSLHLSRIPLLLPIPLSTPSTSRRAGIPEVDTPPRNRLLLATPKPRYEVEESFAAVVRRSGPTMAHRKDRAAVRAKIEVLRSERLAYEQEGIQTREALARSEAYCRALEARVAMLETQARRHEWHQHHVFLAQIFAIREDDKPEGKQVKDVPIIQDFSKVFHENLLAPSEMKELSEQLQELSDKGFLRPSSSP